MKLLFGLYLGNVFFPLTFWAWVVGLYPILISETFSSILSPLSYSLHYVILLFFSLCRERELKIFHAVSSVFLSSDCTCAPVWAPSRPWASSSAHPNKTRHSSPEQQESLAPPHRCRSAVSLCEGLLNAIASVGRGWSGSQTAVSVHY